MCMYLIKLWNYKFYIKARSLMIMEFKNRITLVQCKCLVFINTLYKNTNSAVRMQKKARRYECFWSYAGGLSYLGVIILNILKSQGFKFI